MTNKDFRISIWTLQYIEIYFRQFNTIDQTVKLKLKGKDTNIFGHIFLLYSQGSHSPPPMGPTTTVGPIFDGQTTTRASWQWVPRATAT